MPSRPMISATIDRSLHTVLVVDDNPATRYATARVIRAAGFQTEEAGTGTEALTLAGRGVAAVVLDVHLPDINGFQVCSRLRADDATMTLPIIHLSAAFVDSADKVAGLDAGADAYLVHPVEPAVLIATLQALIRARMAEERLRTSEARFRAIYDQAPTGMALIDDQGRFADINPALIATLGRGRDALLGQLVSAFAPPEKAAFVQSRMARTTASPSSWKENFPLTKPDGTTIRLEWTVSTHIEPGLRVGIALDVSERYELERRRREVLEREQAARSAAEQQSRTKDDFVAVLSHELRNPLNAIGGWVHVLLVGKRTPEQLEKGLSAIARSVKAQARLISDILDVSRISSGKLRLHREWVAPEALVTESLDALRVQAQSKRVEIVLEMQDADEPAWLDGTRFQQILWNLTSNAIKFSESDTQVVIRLARDGDLLRVSVQDSGRGIRPDFLPHIFQRFSQSESPDSRIHGGLGLGLSITKNLAELHGGTIAAESKGEGQGAVFTAVLKVVPDGELATVNESHSAHTPAPELSGLHVLVAEDDPDAREILTLVLSEAGATVNSAPNYDVAIALAGQHWPDVLVSDIGMAGRDGYDLMRAIRKLQIDQGKPAIFAVAHTAFTREQDRAKALEAGFDTHLGKPLQPHALIALLRDKALSLGNQRAGVI
ncbi:response regulator [Alcaligenaceae bacterium B3P038]|nr:response regulator [Alcaligenaceae bacterium B3P038]